jgi:hypothetical protein
MVRSSVIDCGTIYVIGRGTIYVMDLIYMIDRGTIYISPSNYYLIVNVTPNYQLCQCLSSNYNKMTMFPLMTKIPFIKLLKLKNIYKITKKSRKIKNKNWF